MSSATCPDDLSLFFVSVHSEYIIKRWWKSVGRSGRLYSFCLFKSSLLLTLLLLRLLPCTAIWCTLSVLLAWSPVPIGIAHLSGAAPITKISTSTQNLSSQRHFCINREHLALAKKMLL